MLSEPAPMKRIHSVFCGFLLLTLVQSVTAATPQDAEEFQIVEVKRGDTLAKISKKYLEDPRQWPALLKYNKIANPNLIQPGLKLKVPANLAKQKAQVVAVVIFKTGNAQYARAKKKSWHAVFVKLGLYVEDQIKTAAYASVHLQLSNRAVLRIQPESHIIVNKVERDGDNTIFTMDQGRIFAYVQGLKKGNSGLQIRTPSAVAAVRGTVFDLSADDKSSGLACHEGQVDVSAQNVTVEVPEGTGTFVKKGEPPMQPFRLPAPPQVTRAP